MHLPFTFATGEAMLYQTGYPLHGFPDSFHGKSKGSKSKKGKVDKSSSDDLDPKSLLGALMSQDESVYVCQPDPEPKMSYHSSLFSEQDGGGGGDGFGGFISGNSWPSNGETGRCNSKTSSYDPLLATLDSLSLDGEETCSNSELFSALENLGLNAEDLELLLLDERMMQVELGPNHIPTLGDLLTNNEILSYIQDSLENGTEREEQGGGFGPPNPDCVSQQACLTPAVPPAPPIIQLSQQMQQHMSAGVSQPGTVDNNILTPNGHWVVTTENRHHPNNHHHPHTVLKASQLNGEPKNSLLESSQWQLQQDQHSLHLQGSSQSTFQPGFHNQLTTNGSYIPNGHTAFPPSVEVGHAGYNAPRAGGTALNGVPTPDVCHYQSLVAATRPFQLQKQQQMLQQVPPSCPTQSSALELEQILGLSQPQHSLPSLEAYSMFNTTTQDATHSKVRDQRNVNNASTKC